MSVLEWEAQKSRKLHAKMETGLVTGTAGSYNDTRSSQRRSRAIPKLRQTRQEEAFPWIT